MSVDISVRKFASSDAESVIALWSDALPSSQPWNEPRTIICRKLHQKDGLFFVGEQDGQVIATVLAGYDGVRGWIYDLAVAEEHRRRGVGRRMLEEAERRSRQIIGATGRYVLTMNSLAVSASST